ncbi:helix-turn-helix domain-containing protein [Ensifer sp. LC163]|uniref:helix-turn-helix domain-containing protein n=1 Tax=Ensifer sp. LC163 TaxID=1120652 RepID=UPI0039B76647
MKAGMHEKKISQAEIARTLRRDRSTICRELRGQLISHLGSLPAQARQSLTFDRRLEFVSWRELVLLSASSPARL